MVANMNAQSLDLTAKDTFRYWTDDLVRFADLDRVGHVNNVAFAVYLETGRVDFFEHAWPGSTEGRSTGWVIVRMELDFRAQGHYPNKVRIGTRITRIGRSSCTLGQGIFLGDTCIATSNSVTVWANTDDGVAVPIPDDMRAALLALSGDGPR